MRGNRAKTLRTAGLPNPGRKHGGTMKEETKTVDARVERNRLVRKLFRSPISGGKPVKNLLTSKHDKDRQISSLRHSNRRRAAKNGRGR